MNELKVGLITLAAIASTVFISLKVTSNQSGFGTYHPYRTIVADASGIFKKTPIRVAGINAGHIKSIELQGTQALITFEVIEDVIVTNKSILKIKTVGFLGDKYLDIYLGEGGEGRLADMAMVPSQAGGGIEDVAKDFSEVLADVKIVVKNIKESLIDDDKKSVVKKIMQNIKDITEDIKKVSGTLKDNDQNIERIIKNVERVSEQLAYETDRMESDSAMSNLAPMMKDARKSVEDLKEIIADVKAGKGTVGKLLRDEEVIDQVNQTLSGVNRLVNRINNIEAELALYSGVNSDSGSHTQFDIDLYPGPERFFRLGVVINSFGAQVEDDKTQTVTTGGVTTVTQAQEVDNNAVKFNLQIARKVQRWGFRAGLFETTGGLGVDYEIPHMGMKFSSEVFDFRDEGNPRLRLFSEFRLWGVFYTQLKGEDLISDSSNQSFTVTAGLKFTDQDLASLIGLMAN